MDLSLEPPYRNVTSLLDSRHAGRSGERAAWRNATQLYTALGFRSGRQHYGSVCSYHVDYSTGLSLGDVRRSSAASSGAGPCRRPAPYRRAPRRRPRYIQTHAQTTRQAAP